VWFYAIYLFVVTRHGVSGKELQRQLGVAHVALKGHVEIDETLVGGRRTTRDKIYDNKTIVMGMKERGGRMMTEIIPDVKTDTLKKAVLITFQPHTTV
jgi:transposase